MRNVKILATVLRIFAVISALFTAYLYVSPYLSSYTMANLSFELVARIASSLIIAITQPLLIFVAAYLLEYLHDFKHQALERLNPERNEAQK